MNTCEECGLNSMRDAVNEEVCSNPRCGYSRTPLGKHFTYVRYMSDSDDRATAIHEEFRKWEKNLSAAIAAHTIDDIIELIKWIGERAVSPARHVQPHHAVAQYRDELIEALTAASTKLREKRVDDLG